MSPADVWISRGGGPVSLRLHLRSPGAVVAVVWRFRRPAERDGGVGELHRDSPELLLGPPETVAGWGFLVDGYVVPPHAHPPVPYQVVVTVLQGGRVIHQAVPTDHGSGVLGAVEARFRYPFRLRVAPRAGARREGSRGPRREG